MHAAWLLLVGNAQAVDLDEFDDAFTFTLEGEAGNDGVDSALDVAIDENGFLVAAGYLDGTAGHEDNGKVVALSPEGFVLWEIDYDNGVSDASQGSNDRVEAISIEPTSGAYAWCGTLGGAGVGSAPRQWYWVEGWDKNPKDPTDTSLPPVPRFDAQLFRLGDSDSVLNRCFGVKHATQTDDGDLVHTVGWGQGSAPSDGQWVVRRYTSGGTFDAMVLADIGTTPNIDRAFDVAVKDGAGDFLVAGTGQAPLDVQSWHVRFYEYGSLVPRWSHVVPSANGGDARAVAAVYDDSRNRIYVAGTIDNGDAKGSDKEWLVVAYNEAGDGVYADIHRQYRFGDGNGVDDEAVGIAIDENGDVVVGGTQRDPATGLATWRVTVLSVNTFAERSVWDGPTYGGDAVLQGLTFRDERIGLAGWIDEGKGQGPDFAAALLELDTDGDGTTDTIDACPEDPGKAETAGVCGCGQPDADGDGDGLLNCEDGCPGDPNKDDPGECGCGQPDVDGDGDGTLNCDDFCPQDPNKVAVGECGCGTPDDDQDGDGVVRCRDACPDTAEGQAVNDFGCDAEDEPDDDMTDGGGEGCGCQTPSPASGWVLIGLALLGWRSRRRAS